MTGLRGRASCLALLLLGCSDDAGRVGAEPDASAPEADAPDTDAADTATGDTGILDTGTPDTGTPDTGTPDTVAPDTVEPDTGTPDTGTPDADGGVLAWVDLRDFFTEDVCVDALGAVTSDDPYDCGARGLTVRNLRLDEAPRIIRHDRPDASNPYGFQISASVPFRLADGRIGILHPFDFGWGGARRAFLEFDREGGFGARSPDVGAPIDGYDLLEHSGRAASYVGTCDPAGGVQPMVSWEGGVPGACVADDAWLIAVHDAVRRDGTAGSEIARLRIADDCPSDFLDAAYTRWELRDVAFTSGRTIQALVASHYGGSDPLTADHIERFYYVRAYGRARWERWNRSGSAHAYPCAGPTSEDGFTRTDCRDWTFVEAAPDGGQDPRAWPVDARLGRGNLLVNHDFGGTTSYLGPWMRLDDATVSRSILEEAGTDLRAHNRLLAMQWTGDGANTMYQDVDRGSLETGSTIGFGARVWTASGSATADLVVHQIASNGAVLESATIAIDVTTERRRVDGSFTLVAAAARLRFELYLEVAATPYRLDDAWVTPL